MAEKRAQKGERIATMGDDTDILDKLLDAIEADGTLSDDERHRLTLMALYETIRLARKTARNTIPAIFSREPIRATAVLVVAFILLHEFATYINIGIILAAAAKALGVPIN